MLEGFRFYGWRGPQDFVRIGLVARRLYRMKFDFLHLGRVIKRLLNIPLTYIWTRPLLAWVTEDERELYAISSLCQIR